jgi:NADPH-dependent curcumin reductase CurA
MSYKGKTIILQSRPVGEPKESDFKIVDTTAEEPKDGQVVLKLIYLSVDPYLVGKLTGASTYTAAFELNKPPYSAGYAQVVASKDATYKVGDFLSGQLFWSEYFTYDTEAFKTLLVRHALPGDPEVLLGVCGVTGLTAYFGLLEVGSLKSGETVVVSGAAGATGTVVGQIAKIKGCKVIGIAGSDDKVEYLVKQLGFDAAINYKTTENLTKAIKEASPDGVDVYFDNVGGSVSDAAIFNLKNYGRVVNCGAISQYTATEAPKGPRFEGLLVQRRLRFQGFIVFDFISKYGEAIKELLTWHKEGKLKNRVTIENGIANTHKALLDLLRGGNIGKMLVKL